jgi:hypothetical protein
MNKLLVVFSIVAAVAVAFVATGAVLAQTGTTNNPSTVCSENCSYMGRRGGMGGSNGANPDGLLSGTMHDEMIAAFAKELGITESVLNDRIANGETMADIAFSEGFTFEQFRSIMSDVRNQELAEAVQQGTITQEQADWMQDHAMGGMQGMHGRGISNGQGWNNACPNFTTTQP